MGVRVLAHRVDGAGEVVLLLNGGLMTISSWEPVAASLAARYRVVRCDFRGQLLTPGVPPADLQAHVADVVALLDHLGLAGVHVAGTSFGGQVGLLLAALHPERVRSLLVATVVDYPPPSMREAGEALIAASREAAATADGRSFFATLLPIVYSPAFLEAHGAELAARGEMFTTLPEEFYAGGEQILRAIDAMDLRPHLAQICCLTLVVAAELDRLMPVARARAVAEAVPGALFELVPSSGHALVVEAQERFVELLVDFLSQVSAPAGDVLRLA